MRLYGIENARDGKRFGSNKSVDELKMWKGCVNDHITGSSGKKQGSSLEYGGSSIRSGGASSE